MTITGAKISGRERAVEYVWERTNQAFVEGDMVQAKSLDRLHGILMNLTDNEYEALYEGCDPQDL